MTACFEGLALSMVLTELPNGVVRVSRYSLVPAPLECPEGWEVLSVPLSARVVDCVGIALGLLGRALCSGALGGFGLALDDLDVEYLICLLG